MRKHYLLPEAFAGFAVRKYTDAKTQALKAKREFLEKEEAIAILRQESKGLGLIYQQKTDRSGFTLPTKYEGYWLIKPKKNTLIGKRIQQEMNEVCQLIEKWQWSTENALGIYEAVYDLREFHMTVCHALSDGSVLVDQHINAKHILPDAYKISKQAFDELTKESI